MESKVVSAQYLAGFFDGEGCISFLVNYRTNKDGSETARISARLALANTHLPTLIAVNKAWGGHINDRTMKLYGNMKRVRQTYHLHWNKQEDVVRILMVIRPYSITKKDQIDFFLEEYVPTMKSEGRSYFLGAEKTAKRFEVYSKLSEMKKIEFKKAS